MKKTILVSLIAVAMLFAFTACEPQSLDYPIAGDNDIANIVVTEAPKFYAGTDVTAAETQYGTITVQRVGGGTTTGVTAEFTLVATTGKIAVGANPVKVKFGNTTDTTEWMTTVQSIELASLEAKTSYITETAIDSASDVEITGLTGVWADGYTQAVSIDNTNVTKTLNRETSSVVISAKAGSYASAAVSTSIAVKLAPEETPVITAVEVTYGDEDTEVIVGQKFNASLVKVVATYGSGDDAEKVTLNGNQYTLSVKEHTFVDADVYNAETPSGGYEFTAYVINPPAGSSAVSGECTIPVVADYLKEFKVSVGKDSNNEDKPYTLESGDVISENLDKFDFAGSKMAVATTGAEDFDITVASDITVNPAYDQIPEGFTGTFTTYFTLNASANSGHAIENVKCQIEVVAPQA